MKKLSIPIPKIHRTKTKMPVPGSRPGTLQISKELPPPKITRIEYNQNDIVIRAGSLDDLEKLFVTKKDQVVWIDVNGLGDAEVLHRIAKILNIHLLTLEDIAHTHQRPKLEELDGYLFITLRAIRVIQSGLVDNEQISILLFDNLLVTFQEKPGDGFEPIRRRLKEGNGLMRKRGADYLLYALLDVTIDNYFPVIEMYGETMEQLDEQILNNPTNGLSHIIHNLRRELHKLRRAIWPLRDVASTLNRNEINRVSESLQPALRDCLDHTLLVAEFIESSLERASELGDLYQTMVSERANQVMKTLTIVATIFIPLTFLCGLYGMNFDSTVSPYNMPELKWRYGYLGLLGFMLLTLLAMLWFFKRKGWISSNSFDDNHLTKPQKTK